MKNYIKNFNKQIDELNFLIVSNTKNIPYGFFYIRKRIFHKGYEIYSIKNNHFVHIKYCDEIC